MKGWTPNRIMNPRRRTDILMQDLTLNGIWSAPVLFAERKEIKAGTNRRSRSDALIRRSHRRSPPSLNFFSRRKLGLIN